MPELRLMIGEATRPQLEGASLFHALCNVEPRSKIANAPLNTSGNRSNMITPLDSTWAAFCVRAGLRATFEHPTRGLTRTRPRVTPLELYHLSAFRRADGRVSLLSVDSVRLDWLTWWTEWALRECAHPVFRVS